MVTYTFLASAFSLMLVGLFGLLTHRNIIRILLAINILETGVNLLLVALGYFPGGAAPIITRPISSANLPFVDPLPQSLVLTSIVIGLGTTALALAITLRHYRERRSLDLGDPVAAGSGVARRGAVRDGGNTVGHARAGGGEAEDVAAPAAGARR